MVEKEALNIRAIINIRKRDTKYFTYILVALADINRFESTRSSSLVAVCAVKHVVVDSVSVLP